jgi:hypothetical protein
MTEKEVSRLFDELSEAAQALNDESDTVTALIRQFEERLNGYRLGVEAWVTVTDDRKPFRWYAHNDAEMSYPAESSEELQLGFTRHGIKQEWRLSIRRMKFQSIQDGPWAEIEAGMPVPLLEAPRVDRINALEKFPELLASLTSAAKELLGKVKAAKAVVK